MRRVLLAVVLLVAGCASTATPDAHHRSPKPSPSVTASASAVPAPSGALLVAKGHGWDINGLYGAIPAGPCRIRYASTGEPLPDPGCTLGVVDSAVTDTNIASTVCAPGGYTGKVRPPASLTEPVKRKLLAAYGIPASDIGKYELDHLVPLNSGGASDVRNLWPEPNIFKIFKQGAATANDKDVIETYLWQKGICARKVTVSAVQLAMAHDWTTAVASLGLPSIPAGYAG